MTHSQLPINIRVSLIRDDLGPTTINVDRYTVFQCKKHAWMNDAFNATKSGIWLRSAKKKESKYKTSASLISPGKMETKLYQSSPFMLIGCHALPSWIQGALALYWAQSFVGLNPRKMLKWLQYMGESAYLLQSWHCWDLHRSWQQCWNWYTDSAQECTRFWSTTWDQCHQSTRGGVSITHRKCEVQRESAHLCSSLIQISMQNLASSTLSIRQWGNGQQAMNPSDWHIGFQITQLTENGVWGQTESLDKTGLDSVISWERTWISQRADTIDEKNNLN